ncbi:ketopantoate reductase family protein [Cystobacter fuscus]|uniref:ketopantoate reductase family protein n=1 Tax=Cystobacter fuscus TaxID=43 RepID=UPI002B2E9BB5|nr:2-dehydropantoate 2-reductase [Cystobacter fuscus]
MDSPRSAPRILVVGCGGIGGVLLSRLLESGRKVSAVARREEIAQVLRTRGPVLRDTKGERTVRGELEVFVQPPADGAYDFLLLATPPTGVEEAARDTAHLLAPGGAMAVLPNGLCEERVAALVGEERVIGTIVAWGASSPATGVYEQTAVGGMVLGTLRGEPDARLERLAEVLRAVGPVDFTPNLRGARWSKLGINCAISTLGTVGGSRLGPLLRHRFIRELALEIFTEVVQVARAEGVKLEKVASSLGLDWLALSDTERHAWGSPSLVLKHAALLAVGLRYRRMRSSMLAAIERGREPPVDFLNGEVVRHARAHGLAVPVNEQLLEAVHAMARRQLTPGVETLRRIHERTRPKKA